MGHKENLDSSAHKQFPDSNTDPLVKFTDMILYYSEDFLVNLIGTIFCYMCKHI